jgi:hypothetical protein
MKEIRNTYNIFVEASAGETIGKTQLWWGGGVIKALKELGPEGVDWIHLVQVMDQ